MRRVALGLIVAVLCANVGSALTAANAVPTSRSDQVDQAITANALKPAACSALTLTAVVFNGVGTGANELLLGTSGIDSLTGAGGDDCVVGGAGADTLSGGAGTDVCIGGAASDSYPDGSCETVVDDAPACASSTSTVTADADTYINEASATANYGSATSLEVRGASGNRRRTLLHFALPSIPVNCALTGATLRINVLTTGGGTLHVHRAGATFSETTASWNNPPGYAGNPATATAAVGTVQFDVLSITKGLYQGPNTGFNVRDSLDAAGTGTATHTIASREHATVANRPQLVLTFGSGSSADTLAPVVLDTQLTNQGATAGRMELGDRITLTYSEAMSPTSFVAGWTGSATNVVVRAQSSASDDQLTIYNATNTTSLPFGTIHTRGNYVNGQATFGASGTPSTMTMSGSTIVISLGTVSGNVRTGTAVRTIVNPVTGPTDLVGNALVAAEATETGLLDLDF